MRKLIATAILSLAIIIPASVAGVGRVCGPDPAFGYRTVEGHAAAVRLLEDAGIAVRRTTDIYVNPAGAAGLPMADLIIVAGAGILGDPVSNPFGLAPEAFAAFSGIVGITDDQGTRTVAVKSGQVIGEVRGSDVDTAAMYEQYLGSASPTLAGVPCSMEPALAPEPTPAPVASIVPAKPSYAAAIAKLRRYIANLSRPGARDPDGHLAIYKARLADYLSR